MSHFCHLASFVFGKTDSRSFMGIFIVDNSKGRGGASDLRASFVCYIAVRN